MDGDDDALGGHVSRKLPWPLNELSSSFLPSFLPSLGFFLTWLPPSFCLVEHLVYSLPFSAIRLLCSFPIGLPEGFGPVCI